jgi:hypothetical protein
MLARSNSNGSPQLTWSVVIAAIGAFCILAGGGYTIIQNQFNSSDKRIDANLKETELIRREYLSLREHLAFQHELGTVNDSFKARFIALETAQRELVSRQARTPVEGKEVDVLSAAIDKRFDAMQQQINDINRQIAASILQPGYVRPQPQQQPH